MDLSHNRSCINSDFDSRLRGIFASKNRQVDHSFPILSSVLCGKTQSWTRNTIEFLEHLDLFTHFFAVTRHLRFEDVQAMVDLISDPRQISGLPSDLILDNTLLSRLCNLLCDLCTFQHPLPPSGTGIQREWTNTIRRCNEASTLPCKEVTLNGLPIDGQYFPHEPSLYRLSCTMQVFFESRNQGCLGSPSPFGKFPKGRGRSGRIGFVRETHNQGATNE